MTCPPPEHRPPPERRSSSPSAPSCPSPTAIIIGTGLVGASLGCALSAAGWQVHLRDRTISHARVAASLGAGTIAPPIRTEVTLAVAAVPPAALVDVIVEALSDYPLATVTDVGSVKGPVLRSLQERGVELARYVGSHPMAGSQHSGPVTARVELFSDRSWAVTPHPTSLPESIAVVEQMVADCGARLVRMDADDHDTAVAQVSHLPHLLSAVMAAHLIEVPAGHLQLAGQGLRDVTRIASGDPSLWGQIVSANADALRPELRAVTQRLVQLIEALGDTADVAGDQACGQVDSRPWLRTQLEAGVQGTRRIPGKHGMAPQSYLQVVVEIPDAPGALARLFADASRAGVNIEDVRIEHDQVREVGYLALWVTAAQASGLRTAMAAGGWQVQP